MWRAHIAAGISQRSLARQWQSATPSLVLVPKARRMRLSLAVRRVSCVGRLALAACEGVLRLIERREKRRAGGARAGVGGRFRASAPGRFWSRLGERNYLGRVDPLLDAALGTQRTQQRVRPVAIGSAIPPEEPRLNTPDCARHEQNHQHDKVSHEMSSTVMAPTSGMAIVGPTNHQPDQPRSCSRFSRPARSVASHKGPTQSARQQRGLQH